MKFHDGERVSVAKLGGIPPIRLSPMCKKDTEEASFEKATVTIKFTDKAKDTYVKFTGGSPEQAVRHMKLFYSIASKMLRTGYHCANGFAWPRDMKVKLYQERFAFCDKIT